MNQPTRFGSIFVNGTGPREKGFEYTIKMLNICADHNDDCRNCPEEKLCVDAFDRLCDYKHERYEGVSPIHHQGKVIKTTGNGWSGYPSPKMTRKGLS